MQLFFRRFKLQQSVILCQHLYLANCNSIKCCQPFCLRHSLID